MYQGTKYCTLGMYTEDLSAVRYRFILVINRLEISLNCAGIYRVYIHVKPLQLQCDLFWQLPVKPHGLKSHRSDM